MKPRPITWIPKAGTRCEVSLDGAGGWDWRACNTFGVMAGGNACNRENPSAAWESAVKAANQAATGEESLIGTELHCICKAQKPCASHQQLERMLRQFTNGDGLTTPRLLDHARALYERVDVVRRGELCESNIWIRALLSESFTLDGVSGYTVRQAREFLEEDLEKP